jgi:hypothetical protein
MAKVPNAPVTVSNAKLERNLQPRVPRLPIEAVYTNYDVNHNISYNRNRGYKFQHPDRWINERSNNKMIGIRRLQMIPSNHMLEIGVLIYLEPAKFVNIPFSENWIQLQHISNKQLMTFTTGPMFVDENDFPDDDNAYRIIDHSKGHFAIITVDAYM